MFYEKNLRELKKYFPMEAQLLETAPKDESCRAVSSLSGEKIIQKSDSNNQWFNLSSTIDPIDQAKRKLNYFKKKSEESPDFLFLGLGSGYDFLQFCSLDIDGWAILFEPDIAVLRTNLEIHDFTPFFRKQKKMLLLGTEKQKISEQLFQFFAKTFLKRLSFDVNRYGYQIYSHVYQEYKEEIDNCINRFTVNVNTSAVYGKRFAYNMIRNVPEILNSAPIEQFKGAFKDIPIIVVSAGPSLDDSIPDLKRIQNKAIIIAVDSALKPLMDNGIEPNFVATIDIQSRKAVILREVEKIYPDANYLLSCVQYCHPRIVRSSTAKKLFMWVDSPVSQWLENSLGKHEKFGECLSCAHAAFYLARFLGGDPIILIGQDLCYSKGEKQRHVSGTIGTHSNAPGSHRYSLRNDPSAVEVMGNDGKKYPSVKTLAAFIKTFEIAIAETPTKVFNATAIGARIEGAEWRNLKDLEKDYLKEDLHAQEKINELYQLNENEAEKEKFLKNMISFSKYTIEAIEASNAMIENIKKAADILKKKKINQKQGEKLEKIERKRQMLDKVIFQEQYASVLQQPLLQVTLEIREKETIIQKEKDPIKKARLQCERILFSSREVKQILKFYQKLLKIVSKILEGDLTHVS